MKYLFSLALLVFATLCFTNGAPAQVPPMLARTFAIYGTVSDADGKPLPNISVDVQNSDTGDNRHVVTNSAGNYRVKELLAGAYMVTATAEGFMVKRSDPINLLHDVKQDITLPSGGVSTTVEVTRVPEADATSGSGLTKNLNKQKAFVNVSVNSALGPMGYIATPSLTSATQLSGINAGALAASKQFNFPSIILYISSTPIVYTPSDATNQENLKNVTSSQETDRSPVWLDATFTLIPKDASGNAMPKACTDGSIQILGILPQPTTGGTKPQTAADVASGINDAAGALASFYPGSEGLVTSATKALNVVFGDIFPPRPIAYQYSYMDGNCSFGWYFRPNTCASAGSGGAASILGMQTGIVLLKTGIKVSSIAVEGQTLSAWNKRPSIYNKKLFTSLAEMHELTIPSPSDLDLTQITDLSGLPMLISKEQAMSILHITKADDWTKLIASAQLVTTSGGDYVTNASLTAFLTSKQAPAPAAVLGAAPNPTPK